MRAISFMHFKQYCDRVTEEDRYENANKPMCTHLGNDDIRVLFVHSMTGERHPYRHCCEKSCPVMQSCKVVE